MTICTHRWGSTLVYGLTIFGLTMFGRAADPDTAKGDSDPPLLKRLETPVKFKNRWLPLEPLMTEIGKQTNTKFTLDGDSLKFSGYTRNMAIMLPLAAAPAKEVIQQMVNAYPQLCLVLDDELNLATLTTVKGAEKLPRNEVKIRAQPKREK